MFLEEQSVYPRALTAACLEAARRHGVSVAAAEEARAVGQNGDSLRVSTQQTSYSAPVVVNCCGAWAGSVAPLKLPLRPVKGQMLSLLPRAKANLQHVIHAPEVYIVPRSDGRLLVGATIEEKGFDKRVEPETIQRLHQAAANLIPCLGEARMLEAWAGLRPGTPDDLPIFGSTEIPGYFVAAGHFRNGILLAPITARVMSQIVCGCAPNFDLAPFAAKRFLH
jgi:glycine oxidase